MRGRLDKIERYGRLRRCRQPCPPLHDSGSDRSGSTEAAEPADRAPLIVLTLDARVWSTTTNADGNLCCCCPVEESDAGGCCFSLCRERMQAWRWPWVRRGNTSAAAEQSSSTRGKMYGFFCEMIVANNDRKTKNNKIRVKMK